MKLKAAKIKKVAPAAPAQATVQVAAAPAVAKKVTDWRVECGHHASDGSRPIFEHGTCIEVVPPEHEKGDQVTIVYKDEENGPPASLEFDGLGAVTGKAAGAKTSSYVVKAEFKGDTENTRFYHPGFWKIWRDVTVYRVKNAVLPVEIRVHDPRHFKLEVKFPEMKGYKSGQKYSRANDQGCHFKPTHLEATETKSSWSPSRFESSTQSTTKTRDDTSTGSRTTYQGPSEKTKREAPPISLTVGGNEVKLNGLEALGQILECADSIQEIVKSFKENAPQLGWYLDFEWKLMQGTLVFEWYWKEHTDQTAFEYLDAYVQATIFSITLEGGIGIAGLGFKAQLYFQLGGSLDLKVSARRDRPQLSPGFVVPARAQVTGELGVRFEAGNLCKVEGSGSTGIEFKLEFGVNRADRVGKFSVDTSGEWTGIEVTLTASVGAFGIGGKKTFKKTLAEPKKLFKTQWPSPTEYKPPVVSRDRIRQVVLKKLTDGFDVKIATVVRSAWHLNDYLELEAAADKLADAVDANRDFDRKPDAVEGLAAGIRGDLDAIADDNAEHDGPKCVLESQFNAYIAGKLQQRLKAMAPPSAVLVQAAKA